MSKTTKFFTAVAVAAFLLVGLLSVMTDNRPFAYAREAGAPVNAPLWAVTPVAVENPITGQIGNVVPLVTAAITADARVCRDFRGASVLDIQTVVEWASTPDTVTIKLEHSNDNTNYVDGPIVASTVVANGDYLNRYDHYGVYTCANIDVANPSATTYPNVKMLVLPRN